MQRNTWLTLAATAAFAAGGALAAPPPTADGAGAAQQRRPPAAMAERGGGMMGMGGPRMLERMTAELGLSADQQQRIKGIQEANRPAMQQLRQPGAPVVRLVRMALWPLLQLAASSPFPQQQQLLPPRLLPPP